jgi:hypothetical protein
MGRALAIVVAATLAACGGGGGGSGGGGGGGSGGGGGGGGDGGDPAAGPRLDDLEAAELDATCSFGVRCGLFADSDSCHSWSLIPDRASAKAAVDMHRARYNPGQAKACFEAMASMSCDLTQQSSREDPDACNHIFTGTGAMGDACAIDAECSSNHCVTRIGGPGVCRQGTCGLEIALAKIGESCEQQDCDPGAFCNAELMCAALLPQGETCNLNSDCDYGLLCLGTPATCKPAPHINDACDGICAEVNATCSIAGTCVALGRPGDLCTVDSDCMMASQCDTTNKCVAFPTRDMACVSQCSEDSWCQIQSGQTMGVCVAPQANGASCADNRECSTHFCMPAASGAGTCADRQVCI